MKDHSLHDAATQIFLASDKINYLLQNELLHELVESVGVLVLRKAQNERAQYGEQIQRTKRALEKIETAHASGE